MQDYVGYRTQHRQEKKKKKTWWRWLVALLVLIAIFVVLGAAFKVPPFDTAWNETYDGLVWMGRKIKAAWPFDGNEPAPAAAWLPEGKKSTNYLFAVTKQISGAPVMTVTIVASYDSETGTGSLIYLPNDLLVNVPGLGLDQLNNLVDLDEGRIGKTLVTVENLLGIEIDRYVLGTDRDLRIILNQMSTTWTVVVPAKVSYKDPSLDLEVNLSAGKQNMSPATLASYLTYAPAGQEIALCKRMQAFVPTFLDASDDIGQLVSKNASLLDTDASDKELAGIWQSYAALGDRLQQGTIPVKEFKFEQTVVHRVDQEALSAFLKKYLKTDSPRKQARRFKVEVLNGNGVPGIGEDVASKLDMKQFQVVNSANADNFDHADTVILIYSSDPDVADAAEEIKRELETGRIEFRPMTQDIAEITIIVGKDYAQK